MEPHTPSHQRGEIRDYHNTGLFYILFQVISQCASRLLLIITHIKQQKLNMTYVIKYTHRTFKTHSGLH